MPNPLQPNEHILSNINEITASAIGSLYAISQAYRPILLSHTKA